MSPDPEMTLPHDNLARDPAAGSTPQHPLAVLVIGAKRQLAHVQEDDFEFDVVESLESEVAA